MATLTELASRLKLTLVAMTDRRRGAEAAQMANSLPAGAWLILRDYDHADRACLATRVAAVCRARRVKLLIGGDFMLAVTLGVGLHLPDRVPSTPRVRLWRRRGGLLSTAAHGRLALGRAAALGADAALLSPVFATSSHPGSPVLGLIALRRLARQARTPVFALGGITAKTLLSLTHAPIRGVAAVGAVIPPPGSAPPHPPHHSANDGARTDRSVPAAPT